MKPGTTMYSEDWLRQCLEEHKDTESELVEFIYNQINSKDAHPVVKVLVDFVCYICESFQAGDTYAPINVLKALEKIIIAIKP